MNILNQTGQLDKLKRHQLGVIIFVLKKEEGVLSCWLKKTRGGTVLLQGLHEHRV